MFELTSSELINVINYNNSTGVFTWIKQLSNMKVGSVAGTVHRTGYRYIKIYGKKYAEHRLAWLYIYGKWPSNQIDHINECKSDNRICNLRDVTQSENLQNHMRLQINNTSGIKGVSWHVNKQKWQVHIKINKKLIQIGCFNNLQDAINARKNKEIECYKYSPLNS